MRRVRCVRVGEDLILIMVVNDSFAALIKDLGGLCQEGSDVGREDGINVFRLLSSVCRWWDEQNRICSHMR